MLQRRLENDTVTVVVPNHSTIATGTLLSIIRQAGVERTLFEA
ncbi:MAG: type II toxin-antitoxin system HicA family toxin [Dehalococcoidia bacterium]